MKSTRNDGVAPVTVGSSVDKFNAVPAVIGTRCQPSITAPLVARTDNTAVKFAEGAGLVSVKDFHSRTAVDVAEQAIRGTTVFPEKDALTGAAREHPTTLLTMSTAIMLG